MMEEVLSLLRTMDPPDDDDDGSDCGSDAPSEDPSQQWEPLPFPSDKDLLREPSSDEFSELKKRTRMKLSSRRYSRRRKEEAKAQAALSAQNNDELAHLKALSVMMQDHASVSQSQLRDQFGVLLRKTKHSAIDIHRLYELVYPRIPHDGIERETRPDHLAHLKTVSANFASPSQLKLALFNARLILHVLSDPERDGCPDFAMSTYAGWRMVEFKRRGSRFCALASRKIVGVNRDALSKAVWQNADDEHKRISTAAHYAFFTTVTVKSQDGSSVFYSEELHEFPAPFLSRRFMSIHGVDNGERGFWYVKQSLNDPRARSSTMSGSEILSTIIQDGTSDDGTAFVAVDLIVLYDTHGICHLERLVSQEPPLCRAVVDHWERNHLLPELQSVDERPPSTSTNDPDPPPPHTSQS